MEILGLCKNSLVGGNRARFCGITPAQARVGGPFRVIDFTVLFVIQGQSHGSCLPCLDARQDLVTRARKRLQRMRPQALSAVWACMRRAAELGRAWRCGGGQAAVGAAAPGQRPQPSAALAPGPAACRAPCLHVPPHRPPVLPCDYYPLLSLLLSLLLLLPLSL